MDLDEQRKYHKSWYVEYTQTPLHLSIHHVLVIAAWSYKFVVAEARPVPFSLRLSQRFASLEFRARATQHSLEKPMRLVAPCTLFASKERGLQTLISEQAFVFA